MAGGARGRSGCIREIAIDRSSRRRECDRAFIRRTSSGFNEKFDQQTSREKSTAMRIAIEIDSNALSPGARMKRGPRTSGESGRESSLRVDRKHKADQGMMSTRDDESF